MDKLNYIDRMTKEDNSCNILQLIAALAPISRIEISKLLKLSPPTVSRIIDRIYKEGLLECIGVGESSGGRKPDLYAINKNSGYAIGMDISKKGFQAGLFDLLGNQIESYNKPPVPQEEFFDVLEDFLRGILSKNRDKRILGVGIGISGNVVHETNILKYSNIFSFHDVPLQEILSSKLPVPVIVEERVRCAAYCGSHNNFMSGKEDIIYMQIGTGIGAGIVIDGNIYYGNGNSSAGEIGHMILEPNGPECSCGGKGCLEQLASEAAIIRDVLAKRKAAGPLPADADILGDIINYNETQITGSSIIQAAQKGDKICAGVIEGSCKYLAISIINLFMLFNPDKLILTSNLSENDSFLKETLYRKLNELSLRIFYWSDKVIFNTQKDMALRGSALLILNNVLVNPSRYYSI